MTVANTYTPDVYSGTGSQTIFSYTFRILDQSHIKVQIKDLAGVFTTKVLTTDYTVSGVGDQAGGNVTFLVAPLATDTVVITRNIPIVQGTDYTEQGTLPAESLEEALDEITMVCQQINDNSGRAIVVDETQLLFNTTFPTPMANQYIKFNGSATAFESDTIVSSGNLVADTSPQLGGMLDVNGQAIGDGSRELMTFTEDASAVNHFDIENEATGGAPKLKAAGDDTNISIDLIPKGTGVVRLGAGSDNYVEVVGAGTGSNPSISAAGDDTNVGLILNPKGTGRIVIDSVSWPAADGSANQVLSTDGAGDLSWTNNLKVLLSTASLSSSATVDFVDVISSTYSFILFEFVKIVPSAATAFNMRVSVDSGSTFYSTTNYHWTYEFNNAGSISGAASTTDTEHQINSSITNDQEFNGWMIVRNPGDTGSDQVVWESLTMHCAIPGSTGYRVFSSWGGLPSVTIGTIDSVRFFPGVGNLTSGTIRCYGVS